MELKADFQRAVDSIMEQQRANDTSVQKRLGDVEKDVSTLKTNQATTNVKVGVIAFIGSTISGTLISSLMGRWFR